MDKKTISDLKLFQGVLPLVLFVLTGNAFAYTWSSYIRHDLALQLDAEYNALDANGEPCHDANATTWANLVKELPGASGAITKDGDGFTWLDKAADFGGTARFNCNISPWFSQAGLRILNEQVGGLGMEVAATTRGGKGMTFCTTNVGNGDTTRMNVSYSTNGNGTEWLGGMIGCAQIGTKYYAQMGLGVPWSVCHAIWAYASDGKCRGSKDGVDDSVGGSVINKTYIGTWYNSTMSVGSDGQIHAFRIYTNEVSAFEKAYNAHVDNVRYFGHDPDSRIVYVVGTEESCKPTPTYGLHNTTAAQTPTLSVANLLTEYAIDGQLAYDSSAGDNVQRVAYRGYSYRLPNAEPVVGTETSFDFASLDRDVEFTWLWERQSLIDASVYGGAGGTVALGGTEPSTSAQAYIDAAGTVALSATPDADWNFARWSGDVDGIDDVTVSTIIVPANKARKLYANFEEAHHTPVDLTFTADSGDWNDPANWGGKLPVATDTATIPAGKTVYLSSPTPQLASVTIAGTIEMSGWTTALNADSVSVADGGVLTCAGPFNDKADAVNPSVSMSNRVWIVAGSVSVAAGGRVDVSGRGWGDRAGTGTSRAYGPGGNVGNYCGGTYGGSAQGYKVPYGSVETPLDPGSSGCSGTKGYATPGGGAIFLDVSGTVTVRGTLAANGEAGIAGTQGAGAGGSVYVKCARLIADGATISAEGGAAGDATTAMAGAGGRISLAYATASESDGDIVSTRVSAAPGLCSAGGFNANVNPTVVHASVDGKTGDRRATPGTVCLPDMRFVASLANGKLSGELHVPGVTELTFDTLDVTTGYFAFADEIRTVNVTHDLVLKGNCARLDFGARLVKARGDVANRLSYTSASSGPFNLKVGGNLRLKDGARLDLAPAPTGEKGKCGLFVTVGGEFEMDAGSFMTVDTMPVDGSTCNIVCGSFMQAAGATVWADAMGFAVGSVGSSWSAWARRGVTTSEGQGMGLGNDWYHIGAGHGGQGGYEIQTSQWDKYFGKYGVTNDMPQHPIYAGSSGAAYGGPGGHGGGYIRISAAGAMRIAGTLTANGQNGGSSNGAGGAGGAIFLEAASFRGASTAVLTAIGGAGHQVSPGSGGGLITIWKGPAWTANLKESKIGPYEGRPLFAEGATVSVAAGADGPQTWHGRADAPDVVSATAGKVTFVEPRIPGMMIFIR